MPVSFLKNIDLIDPYIGGMPIEELSRKIDIPGDQIIKLASNENPYGISPLAKKAIRNFNEYFLYPDGSGFNLINSISEKFNLKSKQVILGNGSNDILELAARIVANQDSEIMFSEHAFAVYGLIAKAIGSKEVVIPALDYGHDLDGFLNNITKNTKIIFIANPNNPTGTIVNQKKIESFIRKIPSNILLVLDEAYEEYLEDSLKSNSFNWINRFDNLLVSRSFSKAYGLASLRIGFGAASEKIIEKMNQIRQPFNVNSIAQLAAIESLKDENFVKKSAKLNADQKSFLEKSFDDMSLKYISSYGNFISFRLDSEIMANDCYEYLLNKGIILRQISNYGMPMYLRVSIGTERENKIFINKLKEFLGKFK